MKRPPSNFLSIGIDPLTFEVVVNLDQDRTGHITFSPQQAYAFGEKMIKKAYEATEERRQYEANKPKVN